MKRRANHRVPAIYFADAPTLLQGRSVADRQTHNLEAAGSIPAPAPNFSTGRIVEGVDDSSAGGEGFAAGALLGGQR